MDGTASQHRTVDWGAQTGASQSRRRCGLDPGADVGLPDGLSLLVADSACCDSCRRPSGQLDAGGVSAGGLDVRGRRQRRDVKQALTRGTLSSISSTLTSIIPTLICSRPCD